MGLDWPETKEELVESLEEVFDDEDIVRRLKKQARPAVALISTPVKDENSIPIGASKIGGLPDLPQGQNWPIRPAYPESQFKGKHNEHRDVSFPLAFIAQINLDSLSQEEGFDPQLPNHGRLLFFYDYSGSPADFDPAAACGFRLIWDTTPVEKLYRAAAPEELKAISDDEWTCVFKPAAIEPRSVYTSIPPAHDDWDAFSTTEDDDAWDAMCDWFDDIGDPDADGEGNHQLGGWPYLLQNNLYSHCQLASNGVYCGDSEPYHSKEGKKLLKNARDWQLVLQIGCDEKLGLLPSGSGCIHVMMRKQDLKARNFDKAWVAFQCT